MAATDLAYAFSHCPADADANRARCVYYLVPVKMLLGELPSSAMLARYGLLQYAPIVQVGRFLSLPEPPSPVCSLGRCCTVAC